MKFPPVFVVNLETSTDRRKFISDQLDKLGIPFEIFPATNGRKLTKWEISNYDSAGAIKSCGREMTPGEIGCSYSHLYIYKKMLDENIEQALILEDDVILCDELPEILSREPEFPEDWELMFLSHNNAVSSVWDRKKLFGRYHIVKFVEHPCWTSGYILKKSGAEKLFDYGFPIRMPADLLTGDLYNTGVKIYGIKPVCIPQNKEFEETISGRFELNKESWFANSGRKKKLIYKAIDFYRQLKRKNKLFKKIADSVKNAGRLKYFFKQFRRSEN